MSTSGSFTRRLKHSFAGTAISDVNGLAVFPFVPPFPAVPTAVATLQTALVGNITTRISAISAASCTVFVAQGTASNPVPDMVVDLFATETGRVEP